LPIAKLAGTRAHIALHTAVIQGVPVSRVDGRAFRRPHIRRFCRFAHGRHCAPECADRYSHRMRAATQNPRIRRPAVAGAFYPREPRALRTVVAECLAQAEGVQPAPNGEDAVDPAPTSIPKALIAPHAGYVYSGPIAASAYITLRGAAHRIERVVLIGPSHFVPFRGLAVSRAEAFETPLGSVPIDEAGRREVLHVPNVVAADAPHAQEHSLEVQLPFLQVLLGDFRVLPIAAGDATAREVAVALERVWGSEETLIVVSSDLSRYLEYHAARRLDAATARSILNGATELGAEQACGCVGINGLLHTARQHELEVRLLDLRNSGDTASDRSRVVGYGAFALYDATID
jgi:MEMO1 family protein